MQCREDNEKRILNVHVSLHSMLTRVVVQVVNRILVFPFLFLKFSPSSVNDDVD